MKITIALKPPTNRTELVTEIERVRSKVRNVSTKGERERGPGREGDDQTTYYLDFYLYKLRYSAGVIPKMNLHCKHTFDILKSCKRIEIIL